jgi:hypothetical protein
MNEHPKRFERMSIELLSLDQRFRDGNLFGIEGEAQYGVDADAQCRDGGTAVLSAKCYSHTTPAKISEWSEEFLRHHTTHWKEKDVRHFVLATAATNTTGVRVREQIEAEEKRFASLGIKYEVWGPEELYKRLRASSESVRRFLGEIWVQIIFGHAKTKEDVIEALVKVGVKACAPVVGELSVTAAEQFVDLITKDKSQEGIDQIQARILKSLGRDLQASAASEKVDTDLVVTVELVTSIIHSFGLQLFELQYDNFSPERISERVSRRAGPAWDALEERQSLARTILVAFYKALLQERSVIEKTEAEFRLTILEKLHAIGKQSADARGSADGNWPIVGSAVIEVPTLIWRRDLSTPGALLRAEYAVVPFHGRSSEREELKTWCEPAPMSQGDGANVAIRLVTGRGGMGKTRLAIEVCKVMRLRGWTAGLVASAGDTLPPGFWSWFAHLTGSRLLVVDYAETRRELVHNILAAARRAVGVSSPLRIVLLARDEGRWWDELRGRPMSGELLNSSRTSRQAITALSVTAEDRLTSYRLASKRFQEVLGAQGSLDPQVDVSDKTYERVLLLHMAALAAMEGATIRGEGGILDYILQREKRFWSRMAAAENLRDFEDAIWQAMAVITARGGADSHSEPIDVLRQLPLLSDQTAIILSRIAGV